MRLGRTVAIVLVNLGNRILEKVETLVKRLELCTLRRSDSRQIVDLGTDLLLAVQDDLQNPGI